MPLFPIIAEPQLSHKLIFDLNEFKPNNPKTNIRSGTKRINNKIFPSKPIKKLNPKSGSIKIKINE